MLNFYVTKKFLEDLCLEEMTKQESEEKNIWYKILSRGDNELHINGTVEDSEEDPLFIFSKSEGITIDDVTDFIKEVEADNSAVLKDPTGIYLLDIDEMKAKQIQENYGVICQSVHSLDETNLSGPSSDFSPEENETGYGWHKILSEYTRIPSNSIVIADRYLFASDSLSKSIGQENVETILNEILPKTFKGVFNITIIVEYESIKNHLTISSLSNLLNKSKKKLGRSYQITMEIIGVKKGSKYHPITHNRRIISNYYLLKVDHKISAFKNDKSLCSQVISLQRMYSNGLNGYGDAPVKQHTNIIKTYKQFIKEWKNNPETTDYIVVVNGNSKSSIIDFSNRLLLT